MSDMTAASSSITVCFRSWGEVPNITDPLAAASVSQETVKLFSVTLVILTSFGRWSEVALGLNNCCSPKKNSMTVKVPIARKVDSNFNLIRQMNSCQDYTYLVVWDKGETKTLFSGSGGIFSDCHNIFADSVFRVRRTGIQKDRQFFPQINVGDLDDGDSS